MSRHLQNLHGVELVDALLEEWPAAERSTLEWDDFAEGIMAKLESEPLPGSDEQNQQVTSDAKFLLAPDLIGANTSGAEAPVSHQLTPVPFLLRATAVESDARAPHLEETMSASQRDRRSSLQDLAKMANEGPRSQRGTANNGPDSFTAAPMSQRSTGRLSEGSGVVDLQSLSVLPVYGDAPSAAALPSSSVPAAQPTLPSSDTFAVGVTPAYVAAASEAPPSMQESVPPMPLSIAPAYLSDSGITPAAGARRMSGPGVGVMFGGIVGVLAVAAGALFFVVSKKAPANDTSAASMTVAAPADKVVAPVAQVEEAAKPADGAMDPTALPVTGAKTTDSADTGHRVHGGSSKDSTPVAAAATPPMSKKEAKELAAKEAKEAKKVAAEPPPSGIPDNALGAEMKKAAGPGVVGSGVENKADSQFAAGTVPQRPSQGTLTSALGRVLGKAKSCIGPDDPISRASVVFASAGTVSSVTVSGNAAGKPAEACIKTALSSAKLNTPFAEPTYTTTVTIRP